jgi:membrane-associated phospholipid phosphatase
MTNSAFKRFLIFFEKLSLSVLIMIALFFICLWGLFRVVDIVFEDKSLVFDIKIFDLIAPYVNNTNTKIIEVITFLGSQNFLLPANILLILYFLFGKEKRRTAMQITAISVTSVAVMFLLKFILQRERPMVPLLSKVHGYSFPSGHTFTSVTFYGMLAYMAYRNIKHPVLRWATVIFLIIFIFLVGFSRVYLRLHYASDVIAGFCLGTIWLLLARWLFVKTKKTRLQSNLNGPSAIPSES